MFPILSVVTILWWNMKCKTKFQFSLEIHILYLVNKCNKAIYVGRKRINKSHLKNPPFFKDQWSRMCRMWIFYMNSWIKMHLTGSYPRCIYYWRRDVVMKSPLTVLSFLIIWKQNSFFVAMPLEKKYVTDDVKMW